ncbi:MAG: hypothetical protein ABIF08_03700 [Nanoarchaeota archaeon]
MLESLIDFKEMQKKPYLVFIWTIVLSSVAVLFSAQLSYVLHLSNVAIDLSGIFAVMFTIIPSVFFFTLLLKRREMEEEKEILKHYKKNFWDKHNQDIILFLVFFFGLAISFAVWSYYLPPDFFQVQMIKIAQMRGTALPTGYFAEGMFVDNFSLIAGNNLQVLFFSFLFSLIFGAGAVFIIVWNASILGVYLGQYSKVVWNAPIWQIPFSLFMMPHAIPEIGGYVCAALAGGLISVSIIRKNGSKVFKIILIDSIKILILGIILVLIGTGMEVFLAF